MQMKNLVNVILNIITKSSSGSILDTVNAPLDASLISLRFFPACVLLCCLMRCDCVANPMAGTSQKQTEQRQTGAPQATAANPSQNNAAKSDQRTTPKSDALKTLKAFCAHKYTRAVVLAVNVTCFLYFVSELISDWITRREPPNAAHKPQPRKKRM
jgi:hypothetical protein